MWIGVRNYHVLEIFLVGGVMEGGLVGRFLLSLCWEVIRDGLLLLGSEVECR